MRNHWKRTLTLLAAAAVTLVSAGLVLAKKPQPPEPPPPPPISYSITFLGTLPDHYTGYTRDVNDVGEVIGMLLTKDADGTGGSHPFVVVPEDVNGDGSLDWYSDSDGDGINDLMILLNDHVDLIDFVDPDAVWVLDEVYEINNHGQIVGWGHRDGVQAGYRLTPNDDWSTAVVKTLPTLGGAYTIPGAINDFGEVAGGSMDANGTRRAIIYADTNDDGNEELLAIGDLGGGGSSSALAINNLGQVTGYARTLLENGSSLRRAFRYTLDLDLMENLGDFGMCGEGNWESAGQGINDQGDVVGWAENLPRLKGSHIDPRHAFLYPYDADQMIDLGTLGGRDSEAAAINSSGFVVGTSRVGGKHDGRDFGFLYNAEFGMLNLQDLIIDLPEGFDGYVSLTSAINEVGDICGQARGAGGLGEPILLTPVAP